MPQITLEHSNHFGHVDFRALALEIHQLCEQHVGATLISCKSRIVLAEDVIIADGAPEQGFVHCNLAIMSGRTQEQKTALGEAVQHAMLNHITGYEGPHQITLEVVDLDKANYFKVERF